MSILARAHYARESGSNYHVFNTYYHVFNTFLSSNYHFFNTFPNKLFWFVIINH